MLTPGTVVIAETLGKLRLEAPLGSGGQAETFRATALRNAQNVVVKLFTDEARKADDRERSRRLVDLRLNGASPTFCAPMDMLKRQDFAGHVSALIDGSSLSALLYPVSGIPTTSLAENVSIAAVVSHAFLKLHEELGIIHGDIHTENVLVSRKGDAFEISIIDFDNWTPVRGDPTLPPPPMVGHINYMAPELRLAMRSGSAPMPTVKSDRFALAIMLHEIILQRHVGIDLVGDDFDRAMCEGWRPDPARAEAAPPETCGYPTAVLNTELTRLFRRSIHPEPEQRATATQWRRALCEALTAVYACPSCAQPFLTDVARQSCPYCRSCFPAWEVAAPGVRVRLDGPTRVLGRAELGGSPKISKQHWVLRRSGPALTCETIGLNPTRLIRGGAEQVLSHGESAALEAGDRLVVADVELRVRPLAA